MKKRISSTINFGVLSGVTISDFYSVCRRYDVEVINASSLGGLLVKKYHVTIEGTPANLSRVARVFS
jgi:hypothetical protein